MQQILTIVVMNIVVYKSTDHAKPLSICFFRAILRSNKTILGCVTKIMTP